MNEIDKLCLVLLGLAVIVYVDYRFKKSRPDPNTLNSSGLSVVLDHRLGWLLLPVVLGLQIWAGSLLRFL